MAHDRCHRVGDPKVGQHITGRAVEPHPITRGLGHAGPGRAQPVGAVQDEKLFSTSDGENWEQVGTLPNAFDNYVFVSPTVGFAGATSTSQGNADHIFAPPTAARPGSRLRPAW